MVLKNGLVFIEGYFQKLDIEIESNIFTNIDLGLKGEEIIDCTGKRILPGMVDIHTHGCLGFDFCKADDEEIEKMRAYYASKGTTSVLATVMTTSKKHTMDAIKKLSRTEEERGLTNIRGIHLEGPFFKPEKKGAHAEEYLIAPNADYVKELIYQSKDSIRLIAIDPLIENAKELIETFNDTITMSIAHTACDYKKAREAVEWGANHVTHLFNAMNGLHHRDPGIIGAACDTDINTELICDGFHVHPAVVRLMFKVKPNGILLISDTISAAGVPDGNYESGGLDIKVVNGEARLLDGTIAGATKFLYEGLKNAIDFGIEPEAAILSATLNPAKSVGIDSEVGSIQIGKQADFIIADEFYNVEQVYIGGNLVR